MARPRKYATEEERLEARRAYKKEYNARYYQDHKDEIAECIAKWKQEHKQEITEQQVKWYQEHKNEIAEYRAKYLNTKEGRAYNLIANYKRIDKKRGRGNCDLIMPWFVRNIFTKCIYCGESDWKKLGCDRINNDLPHTMENVVPACWDCNNKRQSKPFEQFYWEMKHKTLGD